MRFEVREGYSRILVGAYTHFGAHARVRAHEGTLRIGSKSVIGIRNTVNCWLDIEIGSTCLLGDDVYICDFDHKTDSLEIPIKDQGIVKSPVRIGDDVWVGTKAVVTRGRTSARSPWWRPPAWPVGSTRRGRSSRESPAGSCGSASDGFENALR